MTTLQDQNANPRMLVIITQTKDQKRIEDLFQSLHVHLWYQCRGKGTATSEMLDYFGLSGTTRLITVGFFPKFIVQDIFAMMQDSLRKKGHGIAFTVPLTGIQGGLLQMLNKDAKEIAEKKIKERIQKDMTETKERSQYTVIWVAVNNGYSDEVVEVAHAAGTKGGTVIKSLRHHSKQANQHFGIPLQDEQEIVMIVAPREKKKEVMTRLCNACGLGTPAHGIIISMPVDEVMGIEG